MVNRDVLYWTDGWLSPRITMKHDVILYFAMVLATLFVGLFCIAFVSDLNNPEYDIPAGLYPLLTIIVGAIFGYVFKRTTNGNGNGGSK